MTSVVNRYYDPTTDQFLSIDPDVATTNQPYVFVNDNPLNSTDPLGNRPAPGTACESIGKKKCDADKKSGSGQIIQVCVDLAVVILCGATTNHGGFYVTTGYGIGIPGISASDTSTGHHKPSTIEKGLSATMSGNFGVGAGMVFSSKSKTPLPVIEIGTPGAGFFVTYGRKYF